MISIVLILLSKGLFAQDIPSDTDPIAPYFQESYQLSLAQQSSVYEFKDLLSQEKYSVNRACASLGFTGSFYSMAVSKPFTRFRVLDYSSVNLGIAASIQSDGYKAKKVTTLMNTRLGIQAIYAFEKLPIDLNLRAYFNAFGFDELQPNGFKAMGASIRVKNVIAEVDMPMNGQKSDRYMNYSLASWHSRKYALKYVLKHKWYFGLNYEENSEDNFLTIFTTQTAKFKTGFVGLSFGYCKFR